MENNPGEEKRRYPVPAVTVVTLLAVSVLFGALSSFSPLSVSGMLLISGAAACTSFVCGSVGSPYPLAAGIAAYPLALLFFGDPVAALTACAFLPCALLMNTARRLRFGRSKTMISVAAALGAGCVLYIALNLIFTRGGLGAAAFGAAYDDFMAGIRDNFALMGFTEDITEKLIGYMLVLFPSMAVCLLLFSAYLTVTFYILLCRLFRLEEKLLPSFPWPFEMSFISAVVFIVSYAAALFFNGGKTTPLTLTAENIIIILTPGFTLAGVKRAADMIRARKRNLTAGILAAVAFLLLFYNIAAFFVSVSFFGVIGTVSDSIKKRIKPVK